MERFKHILHTLLFPPKAIGIALGVSFLLFVGVVLYRRQNDTPIAYVAYLLSAYGLYLLIVSVVVPVIRAILQKLRAHPTFGRYFTDSTAKARFKLYRSLLINIGYAAFKVAMGVMTHSYWFLAIAAYYLALISMKLLLVRNDLRLLHRETPLLPQWGWKTYRSVGIWMLVLNLTLTGIVYQTVFQGQSYSYRGWLIFAMAFYAFYRITVALVRIFRGRTDDDPILSAAKDIDLTVAIVALFTLQTAMLSTFGEGDARWTALANSLAGIGALVLILGIAVWMIWKAQRQLQLAALPREDGPEDNPPA